MTTATASGERSRRVLIGALAGSLVIVLGALFLVRAGPAATPQETPGARPEQAADGVRPAAVDSARRGEPAAPEAVAMVPEVAVADMSAERQRWLADPPPQIEPNPRDVARADALTEARPRATAALQAALDDRQAQLSRACWKSGGAESAQVHVQARFAGDGTLDGIDVADHGEVPGLAACVRAQRFALEIDAPGAELAVRATLSLP